MQISMWCRIKVLDCRLCTYLRLFTLLLLAGTCWMWRGREKTCPSTTKASSQTPPCSSSPWTERDSGTRYWLPKHKTKGSWHWWWRNKEIYVFEHGKMWHNRHDKIKRVFRYCECCGLRLTFGLDFRDWTSIFTSFTLWLFDISQSILHSDTGQTWNLNRT